MAYLSAALAAALYLSAYPAGLGAWPLSCVALTPLLFYVRARAVRDRQALACGFAFGLAIQLGGHAFLPYTLEQFSGLPPLACWAIFVVFGAAQALSSALFVWLLARGERMGGSALLLAPALWPLLERYVPAIFPSPFGAALHAAPALLQSAELGGVALVSMWLVGVNCALVALADARLRRTHRAPLALASSVLIAVVAAGALRMHAVTRAQAAATAIRIALVQPNLAPATKRRDPEAFTAAHSALARTTDARRTQLIVWPETAVADPLARATLATGGVIDPQPAPTLFGAVTYGGARSAIYNSALLVDASGAQSRRAHGLADKHELVPFSEYLPLGDRFPGLYDVFEGSGRLTAGRGRALLELGATRIGALVCYEDMIGPYVRELVLRDRPQLLVSLSNDAWFSPPSSVNRAARTHFAVATLRAVEHRRALVRATNTGVSAFIDPSGRAITAPQERAALLEHDAPRMERQTLYARFGDAALLFFAALFALLALRSAIKGRAGSRAATAA